MREHRMNDTAERVLCCVRLKNADLIVTSERFVHQSLTFVTWFLHFLLGNIFFFAPSEAVFGIESSAWSDAGQKLFGGKADGFFGPSGNSQNIINQSRIIHSMPFDAIKELNIQPIPGDVSIFSLVTKDEEIVFQIGDHRVAILFHFLQKKVGNKIKFTHEEHRTRISKLAMKYFPEV
jgi:hypothetical protein